MRNLLSIILIVFAFASCNKSEDEVDTTGALQIEVSGMSTITSISLSVTNQNGVNLLSVTDKFGSTTYETATVKTGDVISIRYSSNIASDVLGNGSGNLKFSYLGKNIGGAGGDLGFRTGNTSTVIIPR